MDGNDDLSVKPSDVDKVRKHTTLPDRLLEKIEGGAEVFVSKIFLLNRTVCLMD